MARKNWTKKLDDVFRHAFRVHAQPLDEQIGMDAQLHESKLDEMEQLDEGEIVRIPKKVAKKLLGLDRSDIRELFYTVPRIREHGGNQKLKTT
jgi:hypothetical protein